MIKIESTTETIESKSGLILAGLVAMKTGLTQIHSSIVKNAPTILTSLFGLMVEGKTDFESMDEKRESLFFKEALNLPFVFAKETVRLYLEQMSVAADEIVNQLKESSVKIIKQARLHGVWMAGNKYLPVDIDTTTMDNSKTKKEGVSRTYQGFDGYHPILAYVGKEGYMLNCELRPGSQHCQKGTVEFIKDTLTQLRSAGVNERILLRMDGGNDSFENMAAITRAGKSYYCIIKRNKRQESSEIWLERAKRHGKQIESRAGKRVWIGKTQFHPKKDEEILEDINCIFEVIERKIDARGNVLLIPEIEVNSWWTNLRCEAEKIIELYHLHATSEQFHSELKHDMDIERLPSGKFDVNKVIMMIGMNAYNTLKLLGQVSIEKENQKYMKRKRLGKVIREIICVGGKLVKHGRQLIIKINEKEPMLPFFLRLNALLGCS